jgi:hypothetical protein
MGETMYCKRIALNLEEWDISLGEIADLRKQGFLPIDFENGSGIQGLL